MLAATCTANVPALPGPPQAGFSVVSFTQPCDGRHGQSMRLFRAPPGSRVVDMVCATKGRRHTTPQMVPRHLLNDFRCPSPNFVKICLQQKAMLALVDTGSSVSFLAENVLNERQYRNMTPCPAVVLNASNEQMSIVGQVFLDVKIGGLKRKSQRFLVVPELMVGVVVVIGMDFWDRVGGFTLDLNLMKLDTVSPETSVPLLSLASQLNSSDGEGRRYSTRSRQPPEKLQADPRRSTYEYKREEY